MHTLVNRQTVPAAITAVSFVTLAILTTSPVTVFLAVVGVVTLTLAVWRWYSWGRRAH
jgi:ABC-type Fe3+ transport system permease subunit